MERKPTPISLDQTVGVICPACNNNTFREIYLLRKISRFVTGQPLDSLIPIPLMACASCGVINDDGQPEEVLELIRKSQNFDSKPKATPDDTI